MSFLDDVLYSLRKLNSKLRIVRASSTENIENITLYLTISCRAKHPSGTRKLGNLEKPNLPEIHPNLDHLPLAPSWPLPCPARERARALALIKSGTRTPEFLKEHRLGGHSTEACISSHLVALRVVMRGFHPRRRSREQKSVVWVQVRVLHGVVTCEWSPEHIRQH